jgi:hypothetical protein
MAVFSVIDFKSGLDVRKTPLTAPGGSLRILENAVLNQGGEVEKRYAFVPAGTMNGCLYLIGHAGNLHAFGVTGEASAAVGIGFPGDMDVLTHFLDTAPEPIGTILDVEPYDDKFFVCGRSSLSATTYCWYDGHLVLEVGGGYSHGTYARTWRSKMYRLDGKYLRFSGVNNPAQNDPSSVTEPGAGFINIALNDPDGENLLGMEIFYGDMAIFSRLQTQIWTLDPDPTKDTLKQVLRIGDIAAHSIVQFGTGDILFLSDSGVRSLKSQSITLAASVSDVGSSIDLALIPIIRTQGSAIDRVASIVQPVQGRYWMSLSNKIYVLSYFPAGGITAWSVFTAGFEVKNFARVDNVVFATDFAGNIYLYGGTNQNVYDSSKVTIRTPHMSADNPTENKRIKSVDVMCQGQWTIQIGMLPNNTDLFELVATVTDNTYGLQSIPFAGYGTHFGVHLEHEAPGPALLAALHFNLNEAVVK